MEKDVTVLYH